MTTFVIIQHNKTGKKFLAKPYWLDPFSKWTIFCEYKEKKESKFKEWGLGFNEYRYDVKVIGEFKTEKVLVDSKNHLTFVKQIE